MAQVIVTGLVAAVVVMAGVGVGASAFTTANIDRDAEVAVTSDASGILGLKAGDAGQVYEKDGQLTIDVTHGITNSAGGLNEDANFTIGASGDAANTHAFQLTNSDSQGHSITIGYDIDDSPSGTIEFAVYDENGKVATATADSSDSFTVDSGETRYVIINITTDANQDDLSGTVTFDVTGN
ncbi:MAG: hypothetical protein J07HQW1_01474 [Haloquadratum walsbyi J07HQW1]|uniref:Uncharacterized protein n=1 Tax=Haloquadratum walsbyi J07HQW1 TaxID=1238424 RepID=U1N4F5_9EURY|nr:MAG: hypothetical protein J07HQW1_01474 [Haloquadratum walsbyi J07HQW1]